MTEKKVGIVCQVSSSSVIHGQVAHYQVYKVLVACFFSFLEVWLMLEAPESMFLENADPTQTCIQTANV